MSTMRGPWLRCHAANVQSSVISAVVRSNVGEHLCLVTCCRMLHGPNGLPPQEELEGQGDGEARRFHL